MGVVAASLATIQPPACPTIPDMWQLMLVGTVCEPLLFSKKAILSHTDIPHAFLSPVLHSPSGNVCMFWKAGG